MVYHVVRLRSARPLEPNRAASFAATERIHEAVRLMDAKAVQQAWHDRACEYSPGYYAYYGPNQTSEAIKSVLDDAVAHSASILELGCSSGRHLAHLADHGYRDLAGIDINEEARTVMRDEYPDLATMGAFYFDAIEQVIPDFEDNAFDVVFSVETLQHIHHDHEWVFEEVARITDQLLVTAELEDRDPPRQPGTPTVTYLDDDVPLYRRDWATVFTALGFVQTSSRQVSRDRFRTFQPGG